MSDRVSAPERIWLQRPEGTNGNEWTWADHVIDASDVEYARVGGDAENAGPGGYSDAPAPHTGHWTGTEENQLLYMFATMTGRTVEECKEPVSHLLHELRYGLPRGYDGVRCEGCERAPRERESFDDLGDGVYVCPGCTPSFPRMEDEPDMVLTDLDAWGAYEGEDGG